jgi:hypothetical protein
LKVQLFQHLYQHGSGEIQDGRSIWLTATTIDDNVFWQILVASILQFHQRETQKKKTPNQTTKIRMKGKD